MPAAGRLKSWLAHLRHTYDGAGLCINGQERKNRGAVTTRLPDALRDCFTTDRFITNRLRCLLNQIQSDLCDHHASPH